MEEKEELKQELEQELQWVQYRKKMLNIIEEKLMQMKQIAEQAKEENLSSIELENLNDRLNNLAQQVRALNSESIKTEYGKMLE